MPRPKMIEVNSTQVSIYIDEDLKHRIDQLAVKERRSFSQMVCILSEEGLKKYED